MINKINKMEEIRKQTVDRIAEFFNGESNNAKVDTYKKLLDFEEEVKKQFSLQGVGSSLPSKEEMFIEELQRYNLEKEWDERVNRSDFSKGFIECYKWITKKELKVR